MEDFDEKTVAAVRSELRRTQSIGSLAGIDNWLKHNIDAAGVEVSGLILQERRWREDEGGRETSRRTRKDDGWVRTGVQQRESFAIDLHSSVSSLSSEDDIERKMMRIFVSFEGDRTPMDIPEGKTVAAVKKLVQDKFHIQPNRAQLGDENMEKNTLVLSYGGAELSDDWVLSDMGVTPGSTIRAFIKEELDPVFYLYVGYNQDTIPILDRIKLRDFTVADLRAMASRRTGLPVGVFRLVSQDNEEMFDCHTLDAYQVSPGDTLRVETWDGLSDLLNLAALGFTSHVMNKIVVGDEALARFQMKVAMYMAAHFGHVDLAVTLSRHGIRSDESVGEHPMRQWNANEKHIDMRKCPVHEAVEAGQLSVLRTFVHQNVCCIMARDGHGLQPLNIALRQKMKPCASFLLTKQWSRISYSATSIPLAIFARMKNWSDRAREKSLLINGQEKSSLKKKLVRDNPLVGTGVYVDGFSDNQLCSRSRLPPVRETRNWAVEEYYRNLHKDDPEEYFRFLVSHSMKLPKVQNRWSRMAGAKAKDLEREHDQESEASGSSPSPDMNRRAMGLPPIHEGLKPKIRRSKTEEKLKPKSGAPATQLDDAMSRPSTSKSIFLETGKKKEHSQMTADKPRKKKNQSASLLAKAKATDGSIPLPLNSINDTPRPFFHVGPGGDNLAQEALKTYEKYRGMKSRDFAVRCLAIANTFKEKPWLHQVRMAMSFTAQGVKKSTTKSNKSMFVSLETASPS